MNICQSSDGSLLAGSSTTEHDSKAGCAANEKSVRASAFSKEVPAIKKTSDQVRLGSLTNKEKQVKILPKKDVLRHLRKASLEESARKLQAMNKELDYDLTKHGKVQLADLAAMVRALNKEMEIVEAVELDVSREPLLDMVKEGSSLRSLLESLKLKLETFLRHKPELKDKKANTVKMLKRGCEFEACLAEEAKGGEPWEAIAEAGFEVEVPNKADLLRTRACRTALHAAEKETTLAVKEVYKEKAGQFRTLNQMTTLSEGTNAVCVSMSGSCAKIMVSGEDLESSREREDESKKSEEGEMVAAMLQVDADPPESSFPEFSIRNFVSAARSKDIKMNWPFSRRSLKLCLNHGVKNLLPSFQGLDSVWNNFTKQCLAETVLPTERSILDEKPFWLKIGSVSGSFCHGFDQKPSHLCTDSISSPSDFQDFALKTARSQSEIESVSTSKVPLSEASDKQGALAPTVTQKTQVAPISVPNKKHRVVVKLGANMDRGTAEDITSTCTVPPVAVATKYCPICGSFSSSSNTTLNAHIDQCLSVEPTEWMKSSKTVKPRIKPRKLRSMSDICATAPCCTLEDLDLRNGRISAAHADGISEGISQRESLRHVKDTGEDSAVYVDATGMKIRILSKTNDASTAPKVAKELKAKNPPKKRTRSKFFSSKKMHIAKYLKLSKAYMTKGCVGGKANFMVGTKHQEEGLTPSFKFQEQKSVIDSGNSMQSLSSERTVLSDNNRHKGKRGCPKCKVRAPRDLFAESHQSYFANNNVCKNIKKPITVETGIDSEPKSMKRNKSSCKVVVDEKSQCPSGIKSMISSPLFEGPVYSRGFKLDTVTGQFTREKCCIPEVSEAPQIHTSQENDVEIYANAVEKNDLSSCANELLSKGIHDPKGGMRLLPLGKTIPSSGQLSIATSTYSRLKKYHVHTIDAAIVASSVKMGGQFNHDKTELTVSGSSTKLPTGRMVASSSRSSDPESYRLANASGNQSSLLQFSGNLFGAEPSVHLSRSCLDEIPEMFYATEGGIDRMDHNSEDIEQGSSSPLVESIPIPGPPGSYLPSFRDSCFEYQEESSLLTTSWVQSSQDVPDINRFDLDSPNSGASTISGSTVANADFCASEKRPQLVPEKFLLGSLGERTGPLAENVLITSVMAGVEAEKLTSDIESSERGVNHEVKASTILKRDCQACCCSWKESIAWNSVLHVPGCQLLRQRMMSTNVEAGLGSHVASSLNADVTNMEIRTGEYSLSISGKEIYGNLPYASVKSELGSSLTKVISTQF